MSGCFRRRSAMWWNGCHERRHDRDRSRPPPVTPPSAGAPGAPAPVVPDLRAGLGRLSRGLIAYGVIGLVVAAIGFGALVWVNGRIGTPPGARSRRRSPSSPTTSTGRRAPCTTHRPRPRRSRVTLDQDVEDAAGRGRTRSSGVQDEPGVARGAAPRRSTSWGSTPLGAAADAVGRSRQRHRGPRHAAGRDRQHGPGREQRVAGGQRDSLGRLADSTEILADASRVSGTSRIRWPTSSSLIVVILLVFTALSLVPAIGAHRVRALAAAGAGADPAEAPAPS